MTDREGRESELRRDAEAPSAEELVEQAHAGVVGRRDALNVIAQLVVALQAFMGEMEALLTAAGRQIAAGPQVAESASAAATEISGSAQEAAARPKEAARSRRRHLPGEQGEPVQIHDEPSELDDAYYDEVRQAVGHGAPSVLLGTSTRSLTQTLDKIKAVEQGSPSARVVYRTKETLSRLFWRTGITLVLIAIGVLLASLTLRGWQAGAAFIAAGAWALTTLGRSLYRWGAEAGRSAERRDKSFDDIFGAP